MKNALILSFSLALATAAFAQTAPQQPEKLTKHELQTLIATAKTPAEHARIARYYEAKAKSELAQADQHAQMAAAFRQNPVTDSAKWSTGTVKHCEYLAKSLRADAARMQTLADEHAEMANLAGGR